MDHIYDAKFLHGIHAYGQMDDHGNREIMSVELDYFESPEDAQLKDMKSAKFWMYRDDALAFAEAIIKSAKEIS